MSAAALTMWIFVGGSVASTPATSLGQLSLGIARNLPALSDDALRGFGVFANSEQAAFEQVVDEVKLEWIRHNAATPGGFARNPSLLSAVPEAGPSQAASAKGGESVGEESDDDIEEVAPPQGSEAAAVSDNGEGSRRSGVSKDGDHEVEDDGDEDDEEEEA